MQGCVRGVPSPNGAALCHTVVCTWSAATPPSHLLWLGGPPHTCAHPWSLLDLPLVHAVPCTPQGVDDALGDPDIGYDYDGLVDAMADDPELAGAGEDDDEEGEWGEGQEAGCGWAVQWMHSRRRGCRWAAHCCCASAWHGRLLMLRA